MAKLFSKNPHLKEYRFEPFLMDAPIPFLSIVYNELRKQHKTIYLVSLNLNAKSYRDYYRALPESSRGDVLYWRGAPVGNTPYQRYNSITYRTDQDFLDTTEPASQLEKDRKLLKYWKQKSSEAIKAIKLPDLELLGDSIYLVRDLLEAQDRVSKADLLEAMRIQVEQFEQEEIDN